MAKNHRIKLATGCLMALASSAVSGGCVSSRGASLMTSAAPTAMRRPVTTCTHVTRRDRLPVRPRAVETAGRDSGAGGAGAAALPQPGFADSVRVTPEGEDDTPPPADPVEDDPPASRNRGDPGAIVPATDRAGDEPDLGPGASPHAPGATDGGVPPEGTAAVDPSREGDAPGFPDAVRITQAPAARPTLRARDGAGMDDDDEDEDEDQEDTDLDRSRAGRRGEGGGPTQEEEEETEEEYKSDLLRNALGLKESPVNVFGWLQGSFTGNAARPASGTNFGVFPNNYANQWLFQQLWFTVEKPIDMKRDDEYQLGFRVDNLSGSDWNQYTMVGFLDNAFTSKFFGYDPIQFYAELHLPWLTEGGVDIKGGRFFALPGYEDAAAPGRPLNSTTYLFSFGQPFTHVGMMSTWHVTDRLNLYNGVVNGWDRWIDQNYRWGYAGGLVWDSPDERTNVTLTLNVGPNQFPYFFKAGYNQVPNGVTPPPYLAGRRNPFYKDDHAVLFSAVVIHEPTDRLTLVTETLLGYEPNVPGFTPSGVPVNAEWYGLAWFTLFAFTDRLTGVYRGDVFRDQNGVRTGYDDTYFEQTLGLIYKPKTWLWFRPEVRWDWAHGAPVYDDGTSHSQFTLGFDMIFLF